MRTVGFCVLAMIGGCALPSLQFDDLGGNPLLSLRVEVATTAEERRQGLVGRTLSEEEALLIVLPGESEVCVDNSMVTFSIDAAFIRSQRVFALERGIPAGDGSLRCHLADHIVEVNAGVMGPISVGDFVRLP